METTIIRLQPNSSSDNMTVRTSASFEDAFGEYSELRGKGRNRRQKRKLDRYAKKDERRRVKGEGRINRRKDRKSLRQEMRSEQQEARQVRKDTRNQRNQGRKDFRTESKQGRENYETEQELYRDSLYPQEEETQDTQDTGYADTSDSGYSQEDSYSEPETGYDNSGESEQYGYAEDADEGYADEGDLGSISDDEFVDEGDYYNADGEMKTKSSQSKLADLENRIKWNKILITKLHSKREGMIKTSTPVDGINKQINERLIRLKDLETQRASIKLPMDKKAVVASKPVKTPVSHGGDETPVDAELNPDFSPNKIVVPAQSRFDGLDEDGNLEFDYDDGTFDDDSRPIIYADSNIENLPDYLGDDEPTPRVYELTSNFDGATNKKIAKNILIGVALGAGLILLANKMKWFKK